MTQAEIQILLSARDNATKVLKQLAGSLGTVATIAAGVVVSKALTDLPNVLGDAAKAAALDEQATKRLEQSLQNIGGDFDAHLAKVNAAITAGQKLAYSDDDVRDTFQTLAAATGDVDEALRRQQVAMDLARGAGISLEQATRMVSKVNDESVQAFKRLGIVIKDGATEQEALAAVQAKFANQAATYAATGAGAWESFQIALSEVSEGIGASLLPVLGQLGGILNANLPTIQAAGQLLADGVARGAKLAGEYLVPAVSALAAFAQYLGEVVAGGDTLNDFLMDVPEPLRGVAEAIGSVVVWVQNAMPTILEFGRVVGGVFGVLGGIVRQVLAGDFNAAMQNLVGLAQWVGQQLGEQVLAWADTLVQWIAPMIQPALDQLGLWLDAIGTWITTTAFPTIVERASALIPSLIGWLGDAIPAGLEALGGFIEGLLNGIGSDTSVADTAGEHWTTAVVEWITTKALPALAVALPKIMQALLEFTERVGEALAKAMARLGAKFVSWLVDVVLPSIPPTMQRLLDAFVVWVDTTAWPWLTTEGARLGTALIDGLTGGLLSKQLELLEKVGAVGQAALDTLKRVFGIASPSKETFAMGMEVDRGLILGMQSLQPQVATAAGKLADAVIGPVNDALAALNKLASATGSSRFPGMAPGGFILPGGLGTASSNAAAVQRYELGSRYERQKAETEATIKALHYERGFYGPGTPEYIRITGKMQEQEDRLRMLKEKFERDSRALGSRAMGGSVVANRAYVVGERGPELFVPGQGGAITPNNRLAAAGAGGAPVMNIYAPFSLNVQGGATDALNELVRLRR